MVVRGWLSHDGLRPYPSKLLRIPYSAPIRTRSLLHSDRSALGNCRRTHQIRKVLWRKRVRYHQQHEKRDHPRARFWCIPVFVWYDDTFLWYGHLQNIDLTPTLKTRSDLAKKQAHWTTDTCWVTRFSKNFSLSSLREQLKKYFLAGPMGGCNFKQYQNIFIY